MSIEVSEVAYHEAGHAVIAMESGFAVRHVSIEKNEIENRWDGKTERPPGNYKVWGSENGRMYFDPTGPITEITIACAGFLAQAKHHALRCCTTVSYSPTNDLPKLLSWMKEDKPQEQAPFELLFTSSGGGGNSPISVYPRWFGGIDRGVLLRQIRELQPLGTQLDSELIEIIRNVMKKFDDLNTWGKVTQLAEALIARCDTRAELTETEVKQALEKN